MPTTTERRGWVAGLRSEAAQYSFDVSCDRTCRAVFEIGPDDLQPTGRLWAVRLTGTTVAGRYVNRRQRYPAEQAGVRTSLYLKDNVLVDLLATNARIDLWPFGPVHQRQDQSEDEDCPDHDQQGGGDAAVASGYQHEVGEGQVDRGA